MGKLEFNQKVGLHNKFHIVVTDVRTGELSQEAWAYNLILKQGFDKIFNNFLAYQSNRSWGWQYALMGANNEERKNMRYGGYIHVGTGVGTPSPTRDRLFDFHKGYLGALHASGWDTENLTGLYTIFATIPPGELFAGPITEVGLASYYAPTDLSTHALLKDSEGEQVFLMPGPYDAVTIYATNYIVLDKSYSGNKVEYVGGSNNFFKKVFVNNEQTVTSSIRYKLSLGNNSKTVSKSDPAVITPITTKSLDYNSTLIQADKTLKRLVFKNIRFPTTEGNNNKGVREVGFTWHNYPVFRSVLPIPGVWTGKDIEDEEVDTGDGQTTVFNLKWPDIVYESEEIYVQGRSPELQVRGTDYTMSDPETSEITFAVAPASGAAITANYAVEYIPKDENHVLDISFTFSFKDANAE